MIGNLNLIIAMENQIDLERVREIESKLVFGRGIKFYRLLP